MLNSSDAREQIYRYVEQLSQERLAVVLNFLSYLVEHDNSDATEELLAIPGFAADLDRAEAGSRYRKKISLPTISRFYGIVIFMSYNDHQPPHFHARYQEQGIIVEIETGVVEGRMSKRALRMVLEWLDLHQTELLANWELARQRKALNEVEPLQ